MINNTNLIGRLTKDVDVKQTTNGKAVATFNLAVERDFKNASGEKETDFINCVVWGKQAEILAQYTSKGSLLAVIGRIQTRNYENQQGQKVYVTEILCEKFQFLDSRRAENKQNDFKQENNFNSFNATNNNQQQSNQTQGTINGLGQFGNSMQIDISDNDLPF